MRIWKYAAPVAGFALLLGASFAFGQQGSKSVTQAKGQQPGTSATPTYYCTYGNSGMYGGMAYGTPMGTMWQNSGMRTSFENLQATLSNAKSTTDPAKVKSLLNQAEQQLSQLTSHMQGWFMGYGNGMMMNGGMMYGHAYRMGEQPGYMMGNPPTANNPQN